MNKEFMMKMLQAKQLEYQAIKEIVPESIVNRIEKLEDEFIDIVKEYFTPIATQSKAHTGEESKENSSTSGNTVHKVPIE